MTLQNRSAVKRQELSCAYLVHHELESISVVIIAIDTRGQAQTCNAAWPEAVANGEGDIILCTDVQDLVPVCVCKVLLVLQEAQLHHIHRSEQVRQLSSPCAVRGTAAPHPQKWIQKLKIRTANDGAVLSVLTSTSQH